MPIITVPIKLQTTPNKRKSFFPITIVLTLLFIWGNSILPATISAQISNGVIDFVKNIIGWIDPIPDDTGITINIRKLGHFLEFALLGIQFTCLTYNNLKKSSSMLLLIGVMVALIDETIQMFSKGRAAMIGDVWLDLSGYCFGIIVVISIHKICYLLKNR